ncbi:MAG: DUF2797 domain-containing protein [Acidobacteria bacterium]|nr:DUF2797 domain-containing protein [Acidobacteriota bacterium]
MRGNMDMMAVEPGDPIQYQLPLGEHRLHLNPYLGKELHFRYSGEIFCCNCGRKTKKSFNQGYCFPCFRKLAECDACILRPEQCHFHLGTCRDDDFAANHCFRPHYVYVANSSGLKVGITREVNLPTRWIDQGASQALPILKVANRRMSGLLEVEIKNHMSDKTNWRALLQGEPEPLDLCAIRDELMPKLQAKMEAMRHQFPGELLEEVEASGPETFQYPILEYPKKISSFNLDKDPDFGGTLIGIKGQYLLFDTGVINIRKYTSYFVEYAV